MSGPAIGTVALPSGGRIGLMAMPGRRGDFASDLDALLRWQPTVVVSLATMPELTNAGAGSLEDVLLAQRIDWVHFPIPDFGTPTPDAEPLWREHAHRLSAVLASGGSVLLHCQAGLGRSGMIALRLMLDAGEAHGTALHRLRAARPGAVETKAQMAWALSATAPRSP